MRIDCTEAPGVYARRDWSNLVAVDPGATIFHTPGFLKLYWEEFSEPDELLFAFGVEEDHADVAAVAFERIGRTRRAPVGSRPRSSTTRTASRPSCSCQARTTTTCRRSPRSCGTRSGGRLGGSRRKPAGTRSASRTRTRSSRTS